MKKIFCITFIVAIASHSFARVLTVSNNANQPAQFTSMQAAFAAAQNNDTLYLFGSLIAYGDLTINKPITIIGTGLNSIKDLFASSTVNTISIENTDNVTLMSLDAGSVSISPRVPGGTSFLKIKYCYMASFSASGTNALTLFNNWLIENCIIGSANFGSANAAANPSNLFVRNSLINNASSAKNVVYVNCQFGNLINSAGTFFGQQNCQYTNCMFVNVTLNFPAFGGSSSSTGNTFTNCLTFMIEPNPTFSLNDPATSNTATGTLTNRDPLFVTQMPTFNGSTPLKIWNPLLKPGSPAINAGTDGTNIGVYGGPFPYRFSFEPDIPIVRKVQVNNPVVPVNGTLQVKVIATKAK